VTVLSRCLQFSLKQMPAAVVAEHLAKLLEAEGIVFELPALQLISRAAAGSMRDALSLLDQAIAHGAGQVASENVRDMLGAVDQTYLLRLVEAVIDGNGPALMGIAGEMQSRSLSFDAALQDLAGLLLRLAVLHAAPQAAEEDSPEHDRIVALAARLDAETVQLYYQIALQGRDDLELAPDEHAGFLMTMLRMLAFRPESVATNESQAGGERSAATPRPATPVAGGAQGFDGDWPGLVRRLRVTGAARELARNSSLARFAEGLFELTVPKSMAHLAERNYQEKLKAALEQHFGRSLSLKVAAGEGAGATPAGLEAEERDARRADASRSVHADPFIRNLVDIFDAKVLDASIKARPDKN
jgi:DNA polymerase-3 subunit gamma/tau